MTPSHMAPQSDRANLTNSVESTLAQLSLFSLLRVNTNSQSISIHRLVAATARTKLKNSGLWRDVLSAAQLIISRDMASNALFDHIDAPGCVSLSPHVLAVAEHLREFDVLGSAELYEWCADAYFMTENDDVACDLYARAETSIVPKDEIQELRVADLVEQQGYAHRSARRFREAEQAHRRALAIREKYPNLAKVKIVRSLVKLAEIDETSKGAEFALMAYGVAVKRSQELDVKQYDERIATYSKLKTFPIKEYGFCMLNILKNLLHDQLVKDKERVDAMMRAYMRVIGDRGNHHSKDYPKLMAEAEEELYIRNIRMVAGPDYPLSHLLVRSYVEASKKPSTSSENVVGNEE
jgi:tetratricopeptide (TPR) repeat protein